MDNLNLDCRTENVLQNCTELDNLVIRCIKRIFLFHFLPEFGQNLKKKLYMRAETGAQGRVFMFIMDLSVTHTSLSFLAI